MKKIKVGLSNFAIVDDSDYQRVSSFNWCIHADGYAINKIPIGPSPKNGRENRSVDTLMHRLILGAKKGEIVDHINGNRLDNRKENLRLVNRFQHRWNSGKRSDNASGYVGVHKYSSGYRPNPWVAQITYKKKKMHLGYFKTPEEASRVYQEKAIEFFGEYKRSVDSNISKL